MNRQAIFKYYWLIALGVPVLAIPLIMACVTNDRPSLIGSLIAGDLAFCYFAQQQKLAEMTLFKELFTDFNVRYDALNDRLLEIARSDGAPKKEDLTDMIDYFNLCAEEYLFYSEGYIHREAWRSWCQGMLFYWGREPFRTVWKDEYATKSYYGLSLDVIQRGAEC